MEKKEILKIYGTDFKEMTKTLLKEADLVSLIPSSEARIGIKPNLNVSTPASFGATTHPEVVAGIVEYLQERGFSRIVVLEGSWVGDQTEKAFEYCGYQTLSEQYGVELWDTQKDSSHTKDCAGVKLHICDMVDRIDFLINVPVLKGHCQTKITCALKNSKGLIPNSEKSRFHRMGLHKPIGHLGVGIPQDFIVVDHICGDLDFEEGGNPVVKNCIMAARDPVLVDAYVCEILHYKVSDVPYVELAGQLGVGCADIRKARISTIQREENEKNPAGPAEEIAPRRRVLDVQYAVEDVDSCSACYAALIPALDRLKEEGLLDKLSGQISIGQGFRGKTGKLGVGDCTKEFEVNIPGCPPDEEQVYETLKNYIVKEMGQTDGN
ncbi:MAG: DUF362 domain-containing protein [Lachnospiraceae bacterium]|nr:DUF362 domain-containing protein [Lachnospiraceae bacterium]